MPLSIKDKVSVKISMLGTAALIVQPDCEQTLHMQRRIWALGHTLEQWDGVQEIVFGMTNLMVVCETHIESPQDFTTSIIAEWDRSEGKVTEARLFEIATTYGGNYAIDLEAMLARTGLDIAQLAKLHSDPIYDVFAVGSAPGFAYLGGLDPKLFMPRKTTPALRTEKGSLTIGGLQTAIASLTGPNGWNAIGYCEVDLFDVSRAPPCLFAPGDRLKFNAENIVTF